MINKRTFIDYLHHFIHDSRFIGIVLFACTLLSLILANTSIGGEYTAFFSYESHWLHRMHLPHSLLHWINDGFMAVFFFLVGMEIKRELTMGELSSFKQAILPIGAAIGGMVIPAFIYIVFNRGTDYQRGWGIPMATDIAFALGVASMLGKRFPASLKIFLMALAIIDDLGAIAVIALFYGGAIKAWWLMGAGVTMGLLWLLNHRKVKFGWINFILGIVLWYCVFNSGIHASIAGVLFAFMIPKEKLRLLEHKFHNTVNFAILPLFALANTAIVLHSNIFSQLGSTLSLGILIGLFLGKPIGVVLATWFLVNKKIAHLPPNTSWLQLAGAGILAGIGFTMSIFIGGLAFASPEIQDISKLSILLAVVLSVVVGIVWMRIFSKEETMSDE